MFLQQCFLTALYLQCIEQMKEEILDAEKDKEKYIQEAKWMTEGKQSLFSESFDNHLAILKYSALSVMIQDQSCVFSIPRESNRHLDYRYAAYWGTRKQAKYTN